MTHPSQPSEFHNDPRLTAYALGESLGDDAPDLDQVIARDPSLCDEIESIRATAALLRDGFAAEPGATLTASQRESVLREPLGHRHAVSRADDRTSALNSPRVFALRSRWIGATLAAAAVLALSVTAAIMFNRDRDGAVGFARKDTTDSVTRPGATNEGFFKPGDAMGENSRMEAAAPAPAAPMELRAGAANPPPAADAGVAPPPPPGNMSAQVGADALAKSDVGDRRSGVARGGSDTKEKLESEAKTRAADPAAGRGQPADASSKSMDDQSGLAPSPAPGTPQHAPVQRPEPTPTKPDVQPAISGGAGGGGGGRGESGTAESPSANATGQSISNQPTSSTGPNKPKAREESGKDETRARDGEVPSSAPTSTTGAPSTSPGGSVAGESSAFDGRDSGAGAAAAQTGNLRPTMRGVQPDAPAAAEPQVLTDKQIADMDEEQVRQSLAANEHARADSKNNSRLEAQLRREFASLGNRLRVLKQQQAEEYSRINDNPFIKPVGEAALSTFAADVDTAAYANVRRFLNAGELPPPDAVRIEELINYFRYDYAPPSAEDGDAPIRANVEVAAAPWNPSHRLVRIGLRGKEERLDMRRATSLVFLLDVSGSMNAPDKLPLVKAAMQLLIKQLNADDRLAIVTYQGNAGLALDSCYVTADNREIVEDAINTLSPGGGTNGAGGISLAYDIARRNFIKDGNNRVILCTDGDFNVGVSGDDALVSLIEQQRESGVFLTVLGFGTGNLKDSKMQKLADKGNGNFAYIDSIDEARKVLVEQMGGTLITIAKDVKFQVEFNPAKVGAYRLIGYEDRLLAAQDFNNDRKDAGEIGSGHTVTALYEVVPVGQEADALALNDDAGGEPSELKYQKPAAVGGGAGVKPDAGQSDSDELCEVRIRHKLPDANESKLQRFAVKDEGKTVGDASADFRFAAAVAEFGMLLRHSPYKAGATFDHAYILAESALGSDAQGYREQFLDLVRKAQRIETGELLAPAAAKGAPAD